MRRTVSIVSLMLSVVFPLRVFAATGTVLETHPYAWSDNVGYINFSGVIVSDSALSGFAWSENKGFISFDPAEGGVSNNGAGNLSGSAWGEQLGWIDFDGVSISGSTGQFSGTATGTLVGTITFDCANFCDVATDWRVESPSSVSSGGGGGGGGGGGVFPAQPLVSGPLPPDPEEPVGSDELKSIDILEDGVFNILDFNLLMLNWGRVESGNVADMNNDGAVNILDFNVLMVHWDVTYQI